MSSIDVSTIAGFTRFNVVGTSGSGKTSFGRQLAETLALPFIELDALYWKANWQHPSDEELSTKLRRALQQTKWVLDGNYDRTRPIKWQNVQCVIWLDYRFGVVFRRSLTRSINRARSGQELWPGTGNIETFGKTFFSTDSILLWMLRQYPRNRRRYSALVEESQLHHIHFVRLRSPRDAETLISELQSKKNVSKT